MQVISLADHNDFVESVTLDGTLYKLHFGWNPHKGWAMDLRDGQNTDIIRSIAVVPNFPLLNMYRRHAGIPPGELLAIVNDSSVQRISRTDFISGKASMVYVPAAEVQNALEQDV